MAQLVFGRQGQLRFADDVAFYKALGFIVRPGRASFHWENNDNAGAWGSEGRIHCLTNLTKWPDALRRRFTAGTSTIPYRINCNDYVQYLNEHCGVELGKSQNVSAIRRCVPAAFLAAFDEGYNS